MPNLNVGIDYRPALSRRTGVGRYVAGLTEALGRIDSENRYTLFSSSLRERARVNTLPPNFELVDRRIPVFLLNALWHRTGQPSLDFLTGRSFSITHSPHPLILPSRRGRTVVTIHDIFFYRHVEATEAEVRRDYVPLVKAHAARADAVLTGSRTTKDDLVRELGVDERKVVLTPYGVNIESFRMGPDHSGDEERIGERYKLPPRYLLSVATLEPRKNLTRLVEAVAHLVRRGWDGTLLLAGGPGMAEPAVDPRHRQSRVKLSGREVGLHSGRTLTCPLPASARPSEHRTMGGIRFYGSRSDGLRAPGRSLRYSDPPRGGGGGGYVRRPDRSGSDCFRHRARLGRRPGARTTHRSRIEKSHVVFLGRDRPQNLGRL